jgi:G patch domain-containing protein 1
MPSAARFVSVGTPLILANEDSKNRSRNSSTLILAGAHKAPILKHEVTDNEGRRRLHGAFKGGYSAGYFNTVGSKEGWTPSQFKSSRKDRAQIQDRSAADFMDEEDEEEQLDGKQLRVKGAKSTRETTQDPLLQLLSNSTDSSEISELASRLLRASGWHSALESKIAVIPPIIPRVQARTGLGWGKNTPGKLPQVFQQPIPFQGINQGTMGDGVVETECDTILDDFDVYEDQHAPKSQVELDALVDSRGPKMPKPSRPQNSAASTRLSNTFQTCSDGQLPLDGFLLCDRGALLTHVIPAPSVPIKWTPKPPIVFLPGIKPLEQPKEGKTPILPVPPANPPPIPETKHEIERNVAQGALNGPNPYSGEKKERYKQFLKHYAGISNGLPVRSFHLTQIRNPTSPNEMCFYFVFLYIIMQNMDSHESKEFAKSAAMFRPMSKLLASKFTSSHVQVGEAPALNSLDPIDEIRDPMERAALRGDFGEATIKVERWVPSRLLCKRFGVPVPKSDSRAPLVTEEPHAVLELLGAASMQRILDSTGSLQNISLITSIGVLDTKLEEQFANMDPLAQTPRPPAAIFQAIFGSATTLSHYIPRFTSPVSDASAALTKPPSITSDSYSRIDPRDVEAMLPLKGDLELHQSSGNEAPRSLFKPKLYTSKRKGDVGEQDSSQVCCDLNDSQVAPSKHRKKLKSKQAVRLSFEIDE